MPGIAKQETENEGSSGRRAHGSMREGAEGEGATLPGTAAFPT